MEHPQEAVCPNSWKLYQEMQLKGVFSINPIQSLNPDVVLRDQYSSLDSSKWVAQIRSKTMLPPGPSVQKQKRKADSQEDRDASSRLVKKVKFVKKPTQEAPRKEKAVDGRGKRKEKPDETVAVPSNVPVKQVKEKVKLKHKERETPKQKAEEKPRSKEKLKKQSRKEKETANPKTKKRRLTESDKAITTASNQVVLHLSDDEENPKAPEEKKVLQGRDVIKQMEKYYTFGIDEIFSIPTRSIFAPPARLCYRMLNLDHVKEIVDSMIQNPGHEPAIADLIPYNLESKSVLTYSNTPAEKRDFLAATKAGKIQFLAISGQHSSAAAKRIIEWAATNANVSDIAEKLKFRKSRILSAATPITVLAEHSFRSNEVNQTMEYKSCFLDTVVHARRQWMECGSPGKPSTGEKACSSSEHKRFQVNMSA